MSALNALHRIHEQDRRRRRCRVTGGEEGGELGAAGGGFTFDFKGDALSSTRALVTGLSYS